MRKFFYGGKIYCLAFVAIFVLSACSHKNSTNSTPQSQDTGSGNTQAQETKKIEKEDAIGLEITDILLGTGAEAKNGDRVSVHYTGTLKDGTKFDSSLDRGQPFSFDLGVGQVIRGWDLGVAGMKIGGKRKLVISPELGYGARPTGPIPANSTLIFEVELLAINGESNPVPEKNEGAMLKKEDSSEIQFSGKVLAGTRAKVLDFNQADYALALASDKILVLYFYATWCPVCKVEIEEMYNAFNELTTDDVVAFRVNYNDDDTDADEVALAREFGIAYQHTKVFIKNGKRVLKNLESWKKERYISEIQSALK